nr:hypothetical protein BaRGS_017552 [Batillaria attramentaria]
MGLAVSMTRELCWRQIRLLVGPPMLDRSKVSPRILSARFNSKGRKVTILQCYAPTNVADEEEKENFYEQLQAILDKAPRRDLKILMGDLNAKVGTDNTDRELIMGKHGTGTQNENGELFTEFCTTNDLVIGGTIFPHKTIHKTTWTSPDGRTVNQIDHITIGRKWRRSLLDVRAKRGADAASDHHLVIAAIKIKLKAYRDQADRPSHKYNVHSLKESVKTNAFRCLHHQSHQTYHRQPQLLDISTNPPTKTEIIKAIKSLKSGKAAGPDGIPPEALKADIQTSTDMLHPLLRKIWENESVPQDWKKGHLVKLPKKGDLSSCSNWRGIMLLSIPGKVLTRIILERLKTALDKTLREEQAGFRNDRSCTDHIATMRIIIEQSLEWQTPLYSTFVDFQKAFDSVDREVIWKLMSHYGFPPKFVNIIRQLQATDGKRTGIQWTFSKQLEDLDFADDIALLSHKQQDAQEKLNRVAEEAEKTGLKINISKTEVMRVNHKQHDPSSCTRKASKMWTSSSTSAALSARMEERTRTSRAAPTKPDMPFALYAPSGDPPALSLRNKIRIFNSNVKSVLLYGSETWRTTKTSSHKLQTFINRCLRNILNIRYPLVITNQDLWEGTRQVPIEQEIKKRKWGWIGHTLRKSTSNVTRQSLGLEPPGKAQSGPTEADLAEEYGR